MNELLNLEDITEESCRERISYNLSKHLKENYYTVTLLSKRSGVSSGAISSYINRESTPSLNNIIRLSRALNCTVSELID